MPIPSSKDLLPYEVRHLFCQCKGEHKFTTHKRNTRPTDYWKTPGKQDDWIACTVCGNYPRYDLRCCHLCDTLYVRRAFDHVNSCILVDTCWDCLNEQDRKMCEDYAGHGSSDAHTRYCAAKRRTKVWDPFALIPRKREDITLPTLELDLDF